ncbi:MAG TPA: aminoglycoside phosphotransferase family protein [Mycobacteriales bacterium]|nr:aminoglycoside phosphotransferase family protein [Mycobacteriales bacterium]
MVDALPERIASEVAALVPGADLDNVTTLGNGIATTAYEITAPSGAWVIRVSNDYPEPWRWRGGRRYEVPLLRELAEYRLPVPRDPFAIEADDGYPVAVVERKVDGRPWSPTCDREFLARQVARFLSVLHRYPVSKAEDLGLPVVEHGPEARGLLAAAAPNLTRDLHRFLDEWIKGIEQNELPRALVHGDVRTEHLYVDADDTLVGIIDFGDASISDPAYDLAKLTSELGEEFGSSLVRHYGRADDTAFISRIRSYRGIELLWQVARSDTSDSERRESLQSLTRLYEQDE